MGELQGSLNSMGLSPLMQFLGTLRQSGRLDLVKEGWSGRLELEQGMLVNASFGQMNGVDALNACALALRDAEFTFVAGEQPREHTLQLGPDAVQAHVDDLSKQLGASLLRIPPADTVLRLAATHGCDSSEQVVLGRSALETVLLVDGRRTVRELLAGRALIPLVRDLTTLMEDGIIVLDRPAASPPAPSARLTQSASGVTADDALGLPGTVDVLPVAETAAPTVSGSPAGVAAARSHRGPSPPTRQAARSGMSASPHGLPAIRSASPSRNGRPAANGRLALTSRLMFDRLPRRALFLVGVFIVVVVLLLVTGTFLGQFSGGPLELQATSIALTPPSSESNPASTPLETGASPAQAGGVRSTGGGAPANTPIGPTDSAQQTVLADSSLDPMLLDTNFAAELPRDWSSRPPYVSWSNGAYRLNARDANRFLAVTAPVQPLRDVVVSVTARKRGGPSGGGYGLVVRRQAEDVLDSTDQVFGGYVLEVGDRGEVGIWRRDGDHWTDLVPWTPSTAVQTGTLVNDVTVAAVGDRLTLVVNGIEVAHADDSTFASGSVGVFVGGDGNQVDLDHFTVQRARD